MGASIDEHKPFLAYGGRGAPHGRAHHHQGSGLQAWVRRRWPLLLAASLGGFYLLRTAVGPAGSSAAGSARLSAGAARVKGCVRGSVVSVCLGVGGWGPRWMMMTPTTCVRSPTPHPAHVRSNTRPSPRISNTT